MKFLCEHSGKEKNTVPAGNFCVVVQSVLPKIHRRQALIREDVGCISTDC